MKSFIQFGPFTGVVSSLDPELIPENSAADLRNVMVEDGRITPRYGYRNLATKQASFSAAYGFDYCQGYNASGDLTQEYVSFEEISSVILPFAANVSTGARTQLKNGSSTVQLTASTYGDQPGIRSFSFNGYAYTISPNDTNPLFRHTIAVTNDFINLAAPPTPTVAPAVQYFSSESDSVNGVKTQNWDNGSGLASSAITFPSHLQSLNSSATNAFGQLVLQPDGYGTSTAPISETFTVSLVGTNGPGALDWTYTDRIAFLVSTGQVSFDPNGFEVSVANAAGDWFAGQITVSGNTSNGVYCYIIADFPNKIDRYAWSEIEQIQITWTRNGNLDPGSGSFAGQILVGQILMGQVNTQAQDSGGNPTPLLVGYTYYDSTTGLESQISPTLQLDLTQQLGYELPLATGLTLFPFYGRVKLYLTLSSNANVTGYRIYARRSTDTDWYLVSDTGLSSPTTPNGYILNGATAGSGSNKTLAGATYDASYDFRETWLELMASSIFALGASPFLNLISACAYKGWVVWGIQGGIANLQHSTIGNELAVYNNADLTQINPQNTAAPANFTLADNGSDDPVAMFPCGQSLIILGSHGVYAQSGYSPTTMSPPAKLPTALGCCGQYACCLFHDDIGNPAVAYMSKNGEGIYLAQEDLYYLNETHYKNTELTMAVRGSIQSFLLAGGASLADIRMGVDQTKDALWILAQNRAMVLRRQSLADQARHWEFYQYTFGEGYPHYVAFDTRNRCRWIRSTGEIDENEWNSSTSSYIFGALSDGGSALDPLPYYQTRKATSPQNTRIMFVELDRENLSDQPTLTLASTRETNEVQVASGKYFVRFPLFQQGREHQITVTLEDGSGYVRRILVETRGPLGDRYFA